MYQWASSRSRVISTIRIQTIPNMSGAINIWEHLKSEPKPLSFVEKIFVIEHFKNRSLISSSEDSVVFDERRTVQYKNISKDSLRSPMIAFMPLFIVSKLMTYRYQCFKGLSRLHKASDGQPRRSSLMQEELLR